MLVISNQKLEKNGKAVEDVKDLATLDFIRQNFDQEKSDLKLTFGICTSKIRPNENYVSLRASPTFYNYFQ